MDERKSILDRATYKKIKGMNKEQMEECLLNIYKNGAESVEGNVSLADIRTAVSKVKGVGEARLSDIMEAISQLYETD